MNRYLNTQELLRSCEFVKEPVDELCSKIEESSSKKIVLCGGRGIGKSTVLCHDEAKKLRTPNKCIVTRFDSAGLYPNYPDIFNEKFYSHYYEIVFSYSLLNYIKRNCNIAQLNDVDRVILNKYQYLLDQFAEEKRIYVNNVFYDDKVSLSKYLETGEIVGEILKPLKNIFKLDTFSVAIDRFDWTNNNQKISQDILSKYFDIFDKVIITTDDEDLKNESNRETLHKKGYTFIDINYGQNKEIVKNIAEKRIAKLNQNINNLAFNYSLIADMIDENLIAKTNGNIGMMMRIVDFTYDMFQWEDGDCNISEAFNVSIDKQLEENKQLRKVIKSPKLHL